MKKIFALIALLIFLAAPAAYAYDFGTAGIVAALGTAGAALALTFGAPAALGTIAIGSIVAGITFAVDHSSTQPSDIEVQLSPSAQLSTPAGWTAPSSGQVEPTPPSNTPSTGTTYNMIQSGVSGQYSTMAEACRQYAIQLVPNDDPSYYTVSGAGCYRFSSFKGTIASVSGCASGYTLNASGTCDLSDANQAMKPSDSKCTIKRIGNSFAVDPRDPDCASGQIPATTAISPNVITSTKADGSTKSVTINADGSSTISESRPNNSTNTTETNTTTLSAPDASGAVKVTGQGSGVAPGTGTQAGSSSSPVNVNFDKSGLATEGTLGGIKSDTGAIKDALTNPGSADSTLATQKSAFDTAVDGIASMFSGETSKSDVVSNDFSLGGFLPSQCGCTPLTINFKGHQASFDWCTPMATFKGVLEWVLGLLTAVYVLSLFRIGGSK